MSRCKFDRSTVLEQILDTFFQYGYYATSMQQIFSATGLKPGSIYSAFGKKAQLFAHALEYYTDCCLETIDELFAEQNNVKKTISILISTYVKEAAAEHYRGCFLLNTQVELTADENELKSLVQQQLSRIENKYAKLLENLYSQKQAKLYAASLMLHIAGLRTYSHREKRPEILKRVMNEGLPWLSLLAR